MASIPELLADRFELLRQLETAYDLLDALQSSGTGTKAEEAFLTQKISDIEEALGKSETEAEKLINQLKNDPVAWTVARLRYMQGYEWAQAAVRAGISTETAKSRVYRFYKKQSRSGQDRQLKSQN